MSKAETLERRKALGLNAVIRGPLPEPTVQMVGALIAGGVKAIEITYSTPIAAQVTKLLDGYLRRGDRPGDGNAGEWFAAGVFGVGAGSELSPTNLAKEGKFGEITRRAQEFIQAVARARDECVK